ncbi:Hypothetical predicted protein [Pelobates cultripes]|uniref:Uncharacterized protein n=1 Tax=Pelobates cultripes TaxID=61616 RepID=A0AAD1VLX9_PELCU|nr:Hypothetical predicted protein [Pelobates cultripes]
MGKDKFGMVLIPNEGAGKALFMGAAIPGGAVLAGQQKGFCERRWEGRCNWERRVGRKRVFRILESHGVIGSGKKITPKAGRVLAGALAPRLRIKTALVAIRTSTPLAKAVRRIGKGGIDAGWFCILGIIRPSCRVGSEERDAFGYWRPFHLLDSMCTGAYW